MKRKRYMLSGLLLLLSSPARADFAMSEMIIDFGPTAPRQHDVEIISRGDDVQYIATETIVLDNPGLPNEKRLTVTDPQKSGLMVTPNKLVLPPGARKIMRLLLLKPQGEQDQIYRLVVKPVIQGIDAPKQQFAIKVLVGYEAIIIVRPKNPKIDLVAKRKGNSLTITNNGNTNANIEYGKQCDALESNCKNVNVTRIYAGQSWTTTLPYLNGNVTYQVWNGTESVDMKF